MPHFPLEPDPAEMGQLVWIISSTSSRHFPTCSIGSAKRPRAGLS
ncbi:hypothetical protein [Kibdelosporangium philippinense]